MGRIQIVTNQSIPTSNEKFKDTSIQKIPEKAKSLSKFEDFEETFTNLFANDDEKFDISVENSKKMDVSPDITSP